MTDRDLSINIRTTGANQAAGEIDDVAEAAEGVDEQDWIAKIRADIADSRQKIHEVIGDLDDIDGTTATAKVDVEADPTKLNGVGDALRGLPGEAGRAGDAIADVFNRSAGIIGTAVAGVGVAMAAWKIHMDRAKEHAAEAKRLMEELAEVSDAQLGQTFANFVVEGALSKGGVQGKLNEFARDNLAAAKRVAASGMAGDFESELNAAIREAELRKIQRQRTEERYGGDLDPGSVDRFVGAGRSMLGLWGMGGQTTVNVHNPAGSPTSVNDRNVRYFDRNGNRILP